MSRRQLPMPAPDEWPRVGKVRLGEKVDTGKMKAGEAITRPSAIDYFRVDGDDGVTSPEAAASFHRIYGDRPTTLRCQLPGRAPGDVFTGAFKLYGARKLKTICDGNECDERTATGGWETQPCACNAKGLPDNDKNRCKLAWTFNFLLPDVEGVGVWQINTGSEISINRVSRWLQMMAAVAGDLMMLDFNLSLVPAAVNPGGRTSTVYVLEPRAVTATPAALMSGVGRSAPPALPSGEGPRMPLPADEDPTIEEDAPIVPGDDDVTDPDTPPEPGSAEDTRAREMLDTLRSFQLFATDAEIGNKVREIVGREINWWEIGDPAVAKPVMAWFLKAVEAKALGEQPPGAPGPGSGQREPDDPRESDPPVRPVPAPLPGQESL